MGRRQTEAYRWPGTPYLKSVLLWLQEYWAGPPVQVYPLRAVPQASRQFPWVAHRPEIVDATPNGRQFVLRHRLFPFVFCVPMKHYRHGMLLYVRSNQGFSLRSMEPPRFTADSSAQSHAFAILLLTSDTAPRSNFPSLTFPSVLRVVLIASFALSGND
jgi:hypothetical protein